MTSVRRRVDHPFTARRHQGRHLVVIPTLHVEVAVRALAHYEAQLSKSPEKEAAGQLRRVLEIEKAAAERGEKRG